MEGTTPSAAGARRKAKVASRPGLKGPAQAPSTPVLEKTGGAPAGDEKRQQGEGAVTRQDEEHTVFSGSSLIPSALLPDLSEWGGVAHIKVVATRDEDAVTFYAVHVKTTSSGGWTLLKRYSHFQQLYHALRATRGEYLDGFRFPGLNVLGKLSPESLKQERMASFQDLMNRIVENLDFTTGIPRALPVFLQSNLEKVDDDTFGDTFGAPAPSPLPRTFSTMSDISIFSVPSSAGSRSLGRTVGSSSSAAAASHPAPETALNTPAGAAPTPALGDTAVVVVKFSAVHAVAALPLLAQWCGMDVSSVLFSLLSEQSSDPSSSAMVQEEADTPVAVVGKRNGGGFRARLFGRGGAAGAKAAAEAAEAAAAALQSALTALTDLRQESMERAQRTALVHATLMEASLAVMGFVLMWQAEWVPLRTYVRLQAVASLTSVLVGVSEWSSGQEQQQQLVLQQQQSVTPDGPSASLLLCCLWKMVVMLLAVAAFDTIFAKAKTGIWSMCSAAVQQQQQQQLQEEEDADNDDEEEAIIVVEEEGEEDGEEEGTPSAPLDILASVTAASREDVMGFLKTTGSAGMAGGDLVSPRPGTVTASVTPQPSPDPQGAGPMY